MPLPTPSHDCCHKERMKMNRDLEISFRHKFISKPGEVKVNLQKSKKP